LIYRSERRGEKESNRNRLNAIAAGKLVARLLSRCEPS
jgi:hypothetical protein